jgi:hypothetical protein
MTPTLHRWGSVSAIAFAALVVAWFPLAAVPDVIDAPEHILDVYADDGVRARVLAGTALLAFAGAFLLAFLADVCALLRAAGREPLADLTLLGGAVCATLLAVAGALLAVLPVLIGFYKLSATVDPDLAAVVVQLAVVVLLLFAPVAAATFVLAISIAALRQRLLAPWLARAGIGVAVALPFSAGGLPLILFVIWIATVGIALRPRRS